MFQFAQLKAPMLKAFMMQRNKKKMKKNIFIIFKRDFIVFIKITLAK